MNAITKDQIALQSHIEALNAKTQEWVDAEEGRWAGMLTTDLKHWDDLGVTTVAQFTRYHLLIDCYYAVADAYSKSYARSLDLASMTDQELDDLLEKACSIIEREAKEFADQEAKENARLDQLASEIGTDRPTLDRWMQDAIAYDIYGTDAELAYIS